jgi:hypothetical protein
MSRVLTEDEIKEEASFIESEPLWPLWPVLPMKHIRRGDEDFEGEGCAVMVAGIRPPRVYLKNLYDLKTGPLKDQLEGVKYIEFETVEDLVRAGWIGD